MQRPELVEDIANTLRTKLPQSEVVLFGSEARGEARLDSDVDLLVLLDKDSVTKSDFKNIYGILYDIELKRMVCINPIVRTKRGWTTQAMTPLKYNIVREGRRIV